MKRLLGLFLLVLCLSVHSQDVPATGLADLKFGQSQIADSQWDVSACMYTATCQIYSKQPGTAYKIPWTSGQVPWSSYTNSYIKLEANIVSGVQNTTNPWVMKHYTSTGTLIGSYGVGHIINMGTGYFFFVGSDNNTGQLFSMAEGMNSTAGLTWTGTLNPTIEQTNTTAAQYGSTTPLAAGQTYTAAPAAPTPTYSSGITSTQQTRKTANQTAYPNGHTAIVEITGDDNIVSIQQIGSSGHFVDISVNGSVNNVEILQTSTGTNRHYMEAAVIGGNNNLILKQEGGSKTQFTEVNGNYNTVNTHQKGTGNHYLDLKVTGNSHTAGIVQDGSGSHKATVELSGTQPWNFQLNQSGTTDKTYSLPHSMSDGTVTSGACYTVGGCSLTINQQ